MCQDCIRLHDELHKQAGEMFSLRKRVTRLQGELRYERRRNRKLTKELLEHKQPKSHYRNGQKRGKRGRNG